MFKFLLVVAVALVPTFSHAEQLVRLKCNSGGFEYPSRLFSAARIALMADDTKAQRYSFRAEYVPISIRREDPSPNDPEFQNCEKVLKFYRSKTEKRFCSGDSYIKEINSSPTEEDTIEMYFSVIGSKYFDPNNRKCMDLTELGLPKRPEPSPTPSQPDVIQPELLNVNSVERDA